MKVVIILILFCSCARHLCYPSRKSADFARQGELIKIDRPLKHGNWRAVFLMPNGDTLRMGWHRPPIDNCLVIGRKYFVL